VLVHLLNDWPGMGRRPNDAQFAPIREEVVPIHDIEITFRRPVKRARLEPEGIELPVKASRGEWRVTVPRLDMHSIVVAFV
jgi:hypothetical protein